MINAKKSQRKSAFQKNLIVYANTHGEEELKAKYEKKLQIGQQAKDATEFAEKSALKRGSVIFDVTPQYREMKEVSAWGEGPLFTQQFRLTPTRVAPPQLLDDPTCQKHLGNFMKKNYMQETLFCWIDCSDFLMIPTTDYRRCKAINIINKYINPEGNMAVGSLDGDVIDEYLALLATLVSNKSEKPR